MMQTADIIQTILLVCVVAQLWLSHRTFIADHERRKKQATFEYVNAVSDRYRKALDTFDRKHGLQKLVDINDLDDEDRFTLRSYLSEIERLSAGINAGVFDFTMLQKMMGGSLQERHHQFKQYILERQKHRATLYIEFDQVVRTLESEKARTYSNNGKIIKS